MLLNQIPCQLFPVDVGAYGHTISDEFAGLPHAWGVELMLHDFVTCSIYHIQMVELGDESSVGLILGHCFFEVSHHELLSFSYGGEVSLRLPLLGQMSHDTFILNPIPFHLRAKDETLFEFGVICAKQLIYRVLTIELPLNTCFLKPL